MHAIRWNPELREWFCAACGRTSDHAAEADARAELDHFSCSLVGIQNRELTEEEREKMAQTKKIQGKF